MNSDVIASVATIPPRIFNGELKKCIDSILSQSYLVKNIYITIPYNYKRFDSLPDKDLPIWLTEEPYKTRVILIRPENDSGSILKYLGIANYFNSKSIDYNIDNPFIFVGDDDQVYNSTLIEKMLHNTQYIDKFKGVIQNHYETVRYGSGGIIHGFVGLLVRASALQGLSTFPFSPNGFCVDDQIMSIYFTYYNIPIIPSKIELLTDIYGELINGREKGVNAPEALHMAGDRNQYVYQLQQYYGIQFIRGGVIQLYPNNIFLPVTLINSYISIILVGSDQYKSFFHKINTDILVYTQLSEFKNKFKSIDCLYIDTDFIKLCNSSPDEKAHITLLEVILKFIPFIKDDGTILIKIPIPLNLDEYLFIKKLSTIEYFKTTNIQPDIVSLFHLNVNHQTKLDDLEKLIDYEHKILNTLSWNGKTELIQKKGVYFKDEFFNIPGFIINLDRNKDRYSFAYNNIIKAGFKNIERFKGIDAKWDDLDKAWADHNNPKLASHDINFNIRKGAQGCMLSHLYIWKHIIENNLPYTIVFEDDVRFHSEWNNIINDYINHTPVDFDILYIGSQLEVSSTYPIVVLPVYCTHAYIITLEGAKKLYKLLLNYKEGVYTIDRMLIQFMYTAVDHDNYKPFKWYVWNATMIPDNYKKNKLSIEKRNTGLVFQDDSFESDVSNYDE